jgi:hypothetical protein
MLHTKAAQSRQRTESRLHRGPTVRCSVDPTILGVTARPPPGYDYWEVRLDVAILATIPPPV